MAGLFGIMYWLIVGGAKIKDNVDSNRIKENSKQKAISHGNIVYYGSRGETFYVPTDERVFYATFDEGTGYYSLSEFKKGNKKLVYKICDSPKEKIKKWKQEELKKAEEKNIKARERAIELAKRDNVKYIIIGKTSHGYDTVYEIVDVFDPHYGKKFIQYGYRENNGKIKIYWKWEDGTIEQKYKNQMIKYDPLHKYQAYEETSINNFKPPIIDF